MQFSHPAYITDSKQHFFIQMLVFFGEYTSHYTQTQLLTFSVNNYETTVELHGSELIQEI